jgi:hypothetical protein
VSGGLWRYHAPEYYIIMDRNIEEGAPSGGLRSTVLTLQEGTVRAVFTSVELARDFAETFYAEEDPVTPVVTSMDAFKLANSVDLSEEVGVREVVFDPEATSVGQWTDPQAIMPLSYYRRFVAELDSGLEKLFAEACATLGLGPKGPEKTPWVKEEKAWVMDWCWSRVEDVAEDARARASELEPKDDS